MQQLHLSPVKHGTWVRIRGLLSLDSLFDALDDLFELGDNLELTVGGCVCMSLLMVDLSGIARVGLDLPVRAVPFRCVQPITAKQQMLLREGGACCNLRLLNCFMLKLSPCVAACTADGGWIAAAACAGAVATPHAASSKPGAVCARRTSRRKIVDNDAGHVSVT